MKKEKYSITEAELSILEILWRKGESTIRDIVVERYPESDASKHATVQKLLDRLIAKGCVHKIRSTPAHRFTAAVNRTSLIDQGLTNLAERLCSGSLTPILLHLSQRTKLSDEDRAALKQMIDNS